MKRLFLRHPIFGWLALIVAFFTVLGHVCVLPHEAHAVTVEQSESHARHGEHSQHDALHAASCEAVQSGVTAAASVLPVAGVVVVPAFAELGRGAIEARQPAVIAASPPLFLLHASFLI